MGEPKSGSKLPIEKDDLHPSAMVMAETQTPSGPVKDTTVVGNTVEKVQEELESFEIKRKALLRDKALAEMDLQHLEEAHQVLLERNRKAKGKASLVEDDAPIRAPVVPSSVQVRGGRFQRGGRGGGRGPWGRPGFRAAAEVTESSEGRQVDPQVRVDYQNLPAICSLCKAFGHSTDRCKLKQTAVPEDVWTLVGRGNPALADMQPEAPAQDIPSSSKAEDGLLGENVRGFAVKGSFVEEDPANEEEVAQVSPAEAIQVTSTEKGLTAQASPVAVKQSILSMEEGPAMAGNESPNPPAPMKMDTLKSKPPDNKQGSSSSKKKKKRDGGSAGLFFSKVARRFSSFWRIEAGCFSWLLLGSFSGYGLEVLLFQGFVFVLM
ncbi:hypothetical protein U1Q18_021087 [Sarracenia purpurea var. burkii]